MIRLKLLLIACSVFFEGVSQDCPINKTKEVLSEGLDLDSNKLAYSNLYSLITNEVIYSYALICLCNYPELKNNKIGIRQANSKRLITAKPILFNKGKGERVYFLEVSKTFLDLFEEKTEHEKVAFLAHELGHLYD